MLNKSDLYIYIFLLLNIVKVNAQDYKPFYPEFYQNGNKLELATAGGLRNARFSNFDFNGDGIKDLYAFDRTSGRSLCFVNLNDT